MTHLIKTLLFYLLYGLMWAIFLAYAGIFIFALLCGLLGTPLEPTQ